MRPRFPVDLAILATAVGVLAVSTSGSLIVFAAAPALAIAFWRNAMAVAVLAPTAAVRRRSELRGLVSREGVFCGLAGVALAGHFATWVPSTKLTTVATATALTATQPIWAGLIAVGQGRRLPGVSWLGIGVAVLGAAVATGADFGVSATAVRGDLLALVGGFMAAVYTSLGERARTTTSTTTYTTVCYSVCALVLLGVCLVSGSALSGYPGTTWAALVALTIGPQLLGHSLFNYALRTIAATTISVVVLLEVPTSAVVAWAWLGQMPSPVAALGLALLVAGVVVVVLGRGRATPAVPLTGEL